MDLGKELFMLKSWRDKMKDFYETSRLILRHFRMGDEQAIYELLSNPDVNRFFTYVSITERRGSKRLFADALFR